MRALGVRMKLNPLRENIAGKRLVVVDDSIVRGTTAEAAGEDAARGRRRSRCTCASRRRRSAGRASTAWTPATRGELLAANLDVDEIREYLDVDTLAYIDLDRLVDVHRRRPAPASAPPASPATTRSRSRSSCARACSRPTGGSRIDRDSSRSADAVMDEASLLPADEVRRRRRPPTMPGPAARSRLSDAHGRDLRGRRASTSPPARRRSSASRTRCAPPSGPRSSATSAASAACSPSPATATGTRCSCRPPTASAPRRSSPRPPAASTPSASTWWPCASTTSSARAPSRCSSSTTSPSASSTPTTSSSSSRAWPRAAARPAARSSAARWPSTPAPWSPASSTSSASRSASSSATSSSPATRAARRRAHRPAVARPALATATRSPAGCCFDVAGRGLDEPAFEGARHTPRPTSCSSRRSSTPRPSWPCCGAVDVRAVAHITGGGIAGNLARVLPRGRRRRRRRAARGRRRGSSPRSSASATIADDEMAKVFNLGIGMVVVVARRRRLPGPRRPAHQRPPRRRDRRGPPRRGPRRAHLTQPSLTRQRRGRGLLVPADAAPAAGAAGRAAHPVRVAPAGHPAPRC